MKGKIRYILLSLFFLLLLMASCSIITLRSDEVDATSNDDAFILIADDDYLEEYKHRETGCHYVVYHNTGLLQMKTNDSEGNEILYCTGKEQLK